MANPLDKLKKMKGKSWSELRERGGQMLAARTDQIGLSGKLPSDEEFFELIDNSYFGDEAPTATDLFVKFYEDAEYSFFPSFRQKELTLETFRILFGAKSTEKIIEISIINLFFFSLLFCLVHFISLYILFSNLKEIELPNVIKKSRKCAGIFR